MRQMHLQSVQTLTSTPNREYRPAAWAWRPRPRRADASAAIRPGASRQSRYSRARGPGNTLYIPGSAHDARCEVGDGHPAQADGEADQTAIENSSLYAGT